MGSLQICTVQTVGLGQAGGTGVPMIQGLQGLQGLRLQLSKHSDKKLMQNTIHNR
jgi:hypothetical protein